MGTSLKDLLAKGYTPEQVIETANIMLGFEEDESEELNIYEIEQVKENAYPSKESGFYSFDDKGRSTPEYTELAKYMRDDELLVCSNHDIHMYHKNDGYYKTLSHTALMNKISVLTKDNLKPSHIENFIKQIKAYCYIEDGGFESCKGKLNFKNGIFNVRTKELIPHNSKHFFKYVLPHNYDQSADCSKWIKFLEDTFSGYEDYVNVLSQIFGYCLYGGYPFLHKAFLFYGEGRNGKSTVIDVLRYILGSDNCSSVPLKNLDKPFSVVSLDGKLANLTGETTTKQIDSESFKDAVAGDYLTAAQKNKPEYSLQVHARFISACNKLPNFGEQTKGIEERLYFVPFKNFVTKSKRDPFIFEKLKTEAPGIMNWALNGLELLLDSKRLPECEGSREIMEEYKLISDSVYAWFKDNVSVSVQNGRAYSTKELYNIYTVDMEKMVKNTVNFQSFSRRFGLLISEMHDASFLTIKKDTMHSKGYQHLCIASRTVSAF